jgi:D-serine deaminase-like pyridoxal phosphate-dependent protein
MHLNDLDTPALWTDLDQLEHNIATLANHFTSAGVAWRPHIKGIKVPAIAHKMIRAGAIGITCAKVSEAEVMVEGGVNHILIANQIVTPQKMSRLAELRARADVIVIADDAQNVLALGAAANARGVTLGVLVEVDTGMNRCGVLPGNETLVLAKLIANTPGLKFMGLQTWEGHNLSHDDPEVKRKGIEHSIGLFLESAALCKANGLNCEILSCGGSGTYHVTPFIKGVTEIEAGGGIWGDQAYEAWGVTLQPSLFIYSTVTSRPAPDRIILDTGFKTAPRGFVPPLPIGVEGVQSVVLSAEHGIVTLSQPNTTLRVGNMVNLRVGYSDSTVFAHDILFGVRKGVVEHTWQIVGRGKIH